MAGALCVAAWLTAAALHGTVPREPVGLEPPSLPVLAGLSGGHRTAAAAAAWSATVVHYANTTPQPETLESGILTAIALDPTLQPPMSNGATLLRYAGGADRVAPILEAGHANFPNDPWFPWALAMHHWRDRNDPATAADWLDRAADLDPSPVYGAAAASLRERAAAEPRATP
jgi:hypothetical protein